MEKRIYQSPLILVSLFLLLLIMGLTVTALPAEKGKPALQLMADVNRNGVIDFKEDKKEKDKWTKERGSLFLNNCDSDENSGVADFSDEVINGPNDLKDLAELRIKGINDITEDHRLTISVDTASTPRVHLFVRNNPGEYKQINLFQQQNVDPLLLRGDYLELRIEANSFADKSWNGETLVTGTLQYPDGTQSGDSVRLRVAPFLLLPGLQKGGTLYVREFPGQNDRFLEQLREIAPKAGVQLNIIPAGEPYKYNDIWLQDCMEIGYTEIPGSRMSVVLPANRDKSMDNFPRNKLFGPDFGLITRGSYRPEFAAGGGGTQWLDWYGNLEVTPPLPDYPLGRIYYGGNDQVSLNPEVIAMFDAQGAQSPALRLDTTWLMIKHVDEMINFLPSGNPRRPYKVMVLDVKELMQLVNKWIKAGHENKDFLAGYQENMTIASFAANKDLIDFNLSLQKNRIEPNIEVLKKNFELTENDLIRVPAFFNKEGQSILPNMVNSTILNGHILISDPHGPVVDGVDLVQKHMRVLLAGIPLQVHFLDDRAYHKWSGNVHCATNVKREGFSTSWWKLLSK